MKKNGIKLLSALFLMAAISSISFAQSDFEKDFSMLHKKAIMTCGLIKKPEMHQKSEMLKGLNDLGAELTTLQSNYLNHPPEEYARDPLWKTYFVEFNDVIDALQTRVEKENYKVAAMNCSRICMIYNKIHTINGRLDLTDKMFLWMSKVTMTTNMLNAANYTGANQSLMQAKMQYKSVIEAKKAKNNKEFNNEFEKIDKLYQNWLKEIENKNYKEAASSFNTFKAIFGKAFLMSLM